jgi:3-deoxy-7-phosphoheptulonate synthase
MFVTMKPHATVAEFEAVIEKIKSLGLTPHPITGTERKVVAVIGHTGGMDPEDLFGTLPGVAEALRVPAIVVMAGPCSVESKEQILETAHAVKAAGATFLRGGAFKPRTSPYEFQGLREDGLKLLALAREQTGLKVVTEVKDTETLDMVASYADVLQIGARNMQNYSLLEKVGTLDKPVLLKRGLSATIREWLMAAEYIVSKGNAKVALCERGIRTFETATRNTLDINAVPVLKALTHLPVIVDPSHGIGLRPHVPAIARAGIAAGADGIIVEVHPHPEKALSDGHQSLTPTEFGSLMRQVCVIAGAVGRSVLEPR